MIGGGLLASIVIAGGIKVEVRVRVGPAGITTTLEKQGAITRGQILAVHWLPTLAVIALVGKVTLVKAPFESKVPVIIAILG